LVPPSNSRSLTIFHIILLPQKRKMRMRMRRSSWSELKRRTRNRSRIVMRILRRTTALMS
jgi:Holliday junction resolvasome RuvABC ATP-dependent DNA helicase subunit